MIIYKGFTIQINQSGCYVQDGYDVIYRSFADTQGQQIGSCKRFITKLLKGN